MGVHSFIHFQTYIRNTTVNKTENILACREFILAWGGEISNRTSDLYTVQGAVCVTEDEKAGGGKGK